MEHIGGCEQRQTRVPVMMVLPVNEFGTPGSRMLQVTEAPGEIGLLLERLKRHVGEGVVVGRSRSTVTGMHT